MLVDPRVISNFRLGPPWVSDDDNQMTGQKTCFCEHTGSRSRKKIIYTVMIGTFDKVLLLTQFQQVWWPERLIHIIEKQNIKILPKIFTLSKHSFIQKKTIKEEIKTKWGMRGWMRECEMTRRKKCNKNGIYRLHWWELIFTT